VDRRTFLNSSVAAGAAATLGRRLPDSLHDSRAAAAAPAKASVVSDFELDELSIAELRTGMEQGRYTAKRLTELYLSRIDEIDRSGPSLNSIIERNPDAVSIAEALDAERRSKGSRGPLHGIPIIIKDNIDTADRMRTSAGSLALSESIAQRDAGIVSRLRDAGAVIIAKTNLSEWANFRSRTSTSGWSGRGGLTRNPYALDRNPCGSSSGTGAGVSANLAAAGIGTETDGSIVCPSNVNGLVGIKPTVGLLSRSGIIPISQSQDTAGPMCRTVADAAALLGVAAGDDARDPATARSRGHIEADYSKFLDPAGLKGARLGVARGLFRPQPAVAAAFEETLAALRNAGATLVDPVEFKTLGAAGDAEGDVLLYEFKAGVNAYLASLGASAPHRSLEDLIRFNEQHRETEMPWFGQETFLSAQKKGPLTSPAYRSALAKSRLLTRSRGIDAMLNLHRLDALVAPTGGPAWVTDLVNGDHYTGDSSSLAAIAGYPSITVPSAFVHGLPVGVSFFGAAWSEAKLIRLAYAFEQATKIRRKPAFLATVGRA
jgi:amidase